MEDPYLCFTTFPMATIYSYGSFDETPKTPTRKAAPKSRIVQDENTLNAPFHNKEQETLTKQPLSNNSSPVDEPKKSVEGVF